MCACGSPVETIEHFLLRCHLYSPQRLELFENLGKVDSSFLNLNVKDKVSFLLCGSQSTTSKSSNHEILKFVINYIKETGRLYRPLFLHNAVIYRYISDINVLSSIHCKRISLLNVESYVFYYCILFSLILYSCLCR